MIKMQQVQPEIKRIQAKYKDDKQAANEEILKFYREQKINPLSGCLPLLMQMPIMIALFRVLHNIQKGDNIPVTGQFDRLYNDIQAHVTSATTFLGMNLYTSPMNSTGSFLERLPYFLVVGLIIVAGVVQSRQTMARQQGAAANPQMQMIGRIMPVFFGFISLNFSAGLNLYFLTSTTWRVGQQQLVINRIYAQEHAKAAEKKSIVEAAARDVTAEPGATGKAAPARPQNQHTARRKRKKRKR
jgi:YidC/Oxa1 family membrane protein insertase